MYINFSLIAVHVLFLKLLGGDNAFLLFTVSIHILCTFAWGIWYWLSKNTSFMQLEGKISEFRIEPDAAAYYEQQQEKGKPERHVLIKNARVCVYTIDNVEFEIEHDDGFDIFFKKDDFIECIYHESTTLAYEYREVVSIRKPSTYQQWIRDHYRKGFFYHMRYAFSYSIKAMKYLIPFFLVILLITQFVTMGTDTNWKELLSFFMFFISILYALVLLLLLFLLYPKGRDNTDLLKILGYQNPNFTDLDKINHVSSNDENFKWKNCN